METQWVLTIIYGLRPAAGSAADAPDGLFCGEAVVSLLLVSKRVRVSIELDAATRSAGFKASGDATVGALAVANSDLALKHCIKHCFGSKTLYKTLFRL